MKLARYILATPLVTVGGLLGLLALAFAVPALGLHYAAEVALGHDRVRVKIAQAEPAD